MNRRHQDVPGNPEDSHRAGDRDDPRQRRAAGKHEQHRHGEVAQRSERRDDAFIALDDLAGAHGADRIANAVERKPAANQEPQGLGRDEWRVDQEQRDGHADHGADRRSPSAVSRRSPQRVQNFDAGRQGEQSADARRGRLRAAEGREDREQAQPECDDRQARDGDAFAA